MRVINLFAAPGVGKSTTASLIFFNLKALGVNCELIQEYAKDKVWEKNHKALRCQPYITAKQFYRIMRMDGEVEIVITDSPVLLGIIYASFGCGESWTGAVYDMFNSFDNINICLERNTDLHPYNPKGRNQTESESIKIDGEIRKILDAKI